ncbi:hypothetical protein MNV84_08370 [Leishmania braziliensis]|nr:hypothetical protein MNV84_08370 [Leishmania braziliensis]
MESVQHSIAPLSPFSWVPAEEASRPGSANVVLHDLAQLDLRFDLIIEEFAIPFHHPLHRIYAIHPLLRDALSPRQLQLLQYGVVAHSEERLVIVAAPPSCGDSGACIAASYEQVFARSMDSTSGVANHPLLPEYTFVVYRLPAEAANGQAHRNDRPEALFRLVFRNIVSQQEMSGLNKAAAPRYRLVAVLTSSVAYYGELQRSIQYCREWRNNAAAARVCNPPLSGVSSAESASSHTMVPEAVAREVRTASPLSTLCSSLARVLERFSPEETGVEFKGIPSRDVVSCDAAVVATGSVARGPCVVEARDPWAYLYTREGSRLRRRIDVVQGTSAVLRAWREGEMDATDFLVTRVAESKSCSSDVHFHKSTHPLLSLASQTAPCARLLLLSSRREVSTLFVNNEVTSFLPKGEAYDEAGGKSWGVVYACPGAERLRRWVLQGLVCAEAHQVHAVFLELDPVDLLSPCVELLYEGSDTESVDDVKDEMSVDEARAIFQLRYRRALFLVCQVVMETTERFVRSSGLVWKVTVAVKELGDNKSALGFKNPKCAIAPTCAAETIFTSIPFTSWCREILEVIRNAAVALESTAGLMTLSFPDDSEGAVGNEAAAAEAVSTSSMQTNALVVQPDSSKRAVMCPKESVQGALALFSRDAAGPAAPMPPCIAARAKVAGVKVSDDTMYPLFKALCAAARQHNALPVSALMDLLLEEWNGGAVKWRHYSPSRLICPLDSCGVPINRSRVQRFLLPFLQVMRGSTGMDGQCTIQRKSPVAADTMNYAQFSMVMLAIAKM